ncbi:hypothetical protein [Methylocystis bryophila]|uniref:Peptide ABC transporter permease n=1 Tax=Methylocystis bryophila TaxID=655015 RepID=A0A1W6MYJ7_9HYPH|nr:hypothetical protein [Methylocystis bryophila]ARN82662.1 hypothetical protein B1812_17925 [Methylocystis bryophila]BDV38878.1 hypothetical protein DSM21852_21310 [Methylocystis bryophila]
MTAFTPPHTKENPALEAGRLLTRIGVFLLFVVALIAPIIAGLTIYILLPIGAVLLLMGAAVAPNRREKTAPLREFLTAPPFLAALFLAAWAALSLSWTPFQGGPAERYWKDAGTLFLAAIACGFLPTRTRICDLNLLPIGVAAAAVGMIGAAAYGLFAHRSFTLEEILDGDALARSGVGLVLIMWPAAGALAMRGKWRFAAALMLVSGLAVLLSGAQNVAPPLIAGFAIFGLSFGRPREARLWLAPIAAAAILFSPLLALGVRFLYHGHAPELLKSLDVWGHIFASGGVRSLLGHGFGSAIYGLFGGYLDPKSPRSLAFQIWFDLGIVGAGAFALAAYEAVSFVGLARPSLAPFLLAGLSAGLVVCLLGPAGEQLWAFTLEGLAVVAFVMVMRGQFGKKRPHLPRWAIVDDED